MKKILTISMCLLIATAVMAQVNTGPDSGPASGVAITGGAIDGATIGGTTPAAVTGTTVTGTTVTDGTFTTTAGAVSGVTTLGIGGALSGVTTLAMSGALSGLTNISQSGYLAVDLPAVSSVVTANTITANASIIRVQGTSNAIDLSSDPQISAGVAGQILILVGEDDTNTVTIDDGTGVQTAAAASHALGDGDVLMLYYDDDATLWREISFSNN